MKKEYHKKSSVKERWKGKKRMKEFKNLKERGEKAKTVLDILQKSCFHPEGLLGDFFFLNVNQKKNSRRNYDDNKILTRATILCCYP